MIANQKYIVHSTVKALMLSVFISSSTSSSLYAQTLSLDQGIFGYFGGMRDLGYEAYDEWSQTFNVLSFSDSLSSSIDYKIGIGFVEVGENYRSLTPRHVSPAIVSSSYQADYISASIGMQYWFAKQGRKGLFLESRLSPLFRLSANLSKTELDSLDMVVSTEKEVTEDFASFVVLWTNAIGYRVNVYNNLFLEATFGMMIRAGTTDDFRSDKVHFGRFGTLGVVYRLKG